MNKIDFQQTGGFPLDTDVLNFLQKAYQLLQVFGEVAGNYSILQGCTQSGSTVSDGVVYLNGEVFPFKSGSGSNVVIREEKRALPFEDGMRKEVEITRYATFGVSDLKWTKFKRVDNLQELMHKLATHTHAWEKITGKPVEFPPTTHTHSYNDLTDKPLLGGQILVAGMIGCNPRRVIRRYVGDFEVYPYPNSNNREHHKIVHNLGHTDYIVTGSAVRTDGNMSSIKFNCYYMSANYCYVITADDSSGNESDFAFQITSFR